MTDFVVTLPASQFTPAEAFRIFTGKPPLTLAERLRREEEHQRYIAERRAETRREIEAMRDRICKMVSPECAARFRADWAEQDAGGIAA